MRTMIKKLFNQAILNSGDSWDSAAERKREQYGMCADMEEEQIPAEKRLIKEATPPSVHALSKKMGFDWCVSTGYGSVEEYEFLAKISSGSYGVVHKAEEKNTGEMVAIKEAFGGFCKSSSREIDILKCVTGHPSFVEFKQVVVDEDDGLYIVMEYVANDLRRAMKSMQVPSDETQVKSLIKQLLEGVHFLHENGIMHRDLKPSNILLNDNGQLKICDFGLSRHFETTFDSYSPRVATLWYKAPELLLGAGKYSCAVDMWAVGCILAELLLGEAIFKGKSEIDQLKKIYEILGTPNDTILPGFSSFPGSKLKLAEQPLNLLARNFPVLSQLQLHLLSKLLAYNPEERMTAKDALDHIWFREI